MESQVPIALLASSLQLIPNWHAKKLKLYSRIYLQLPKIPRHFKNTLSRKKQTNINIHLKLKIFIYLGTMDTVNRSFTHS